MLIQTIAIEGTEEITTVKDTITTFEISEDVTIYLSETERLATVFFGDIDFLVRFNNLVIDTINKMYEAKNDIELIFLLQVLKNISVSEEEF